MLDVIRKYGFSDEKVLAAIEKTPREYFVPDEQRELANEDRALPIGFGQTISQPYTVAFMTHLLDLKGGEKVLEIGTGSGYQAAVLSHLAKSVYSVERIKELFEEANKNLKKNGVKNVYLKHGDGAKGWHEYAPYDRILITADIFGEVPKELLSQLKTDGILVAPVKGEMTKIVKGKKGLKTTKHGQFSFVPFIDG